jgi:hypothetical protein
VAAEDARRVHQDHERGRGQEAPAGSAHPSGQRVDEQGQQRALQHHGGGQGPDARSGHEHHQRVEVDDPGAHELEEVAVHDLAGPHARALVEEDAAAPDVEEENGRGAAEEDQEEQRRGSGGHDRPLRFHGVPATGSADRIASAASR